MNSKSKSVIFSGAIAAGLMGSSAALAKPAPELVTPDISANARGTSTLIILRQREVQVGDVQSDDGSWGDSAEGRWTDAASTGAGTQFGLAGAVLGGLIGGEIDAANKAKRKKIQDALEAPILAALANVDVDALALKTTDVALQKVSWLNSSPQKFAKDNSLKSESDFINSSGADQIFIINYTYHMNSNFEYMQLMAVLEVLKKSALSGKEIEKILKPEYLSYWRAVIVYVPLPNAKINNDWANGTMWADDNGNFAKKALNLAFQTVSDYIPRVLSLTENDISAMNDKNLPKIKYDNITFHKIESTREKTVLWNGTFQIIANIN